MEQEQPVRAREWPGTGPVTLRAPWLARFGVPLAFLGASALAAALAVEMSDEVLARWVAGVPAGLGLLWSVVLWRRRAVLSPEGVEVREIFTRRVRFEELVDLRWDGRRYRFYLFLPLGRVARLTLRSARGRVVFHNGFKGFDRWAPLAADLAVAAAVRRLREAILRGEPARIGPLLVDAHSVRVAARLGPERRVPLAELRIDVGDGALTLSDGAGPVARLQVRRIPNLLALPQLVSDLAANRDRPRPTQLLEALARPAPP